MNKDQELLELRRREALLSGIVREVVRIAAVAQVDPVSIPIAVALEGRLRRDWALVLQRAQMLVGP